MNTGRIRGFLLQLPKPAMVRVTGDGEPQELKPGRSYSKLAETILALAPELIECLDSDGKVLRATRMEGAEQRRSDAAEIPEQLKSDPTALMLTHFANLLHRAYEHSTEVAFTRLVELTDRMNDRSEGIEQRLERQEATNRKLLQDQVDDALDRAEEAAAKAAEGEPGGLGEQLLGSFLGGKAQRAAPAPNGKAGH